MANVRNIIETAKSANGQRFELTYSDPRDCGGWEVTSWGPACGQHNWTRGFGSEGDARDHMQRAA